MSNNQNNLNNNETGNHNVDNVQEDTLEDFDSNTWIAPSEMQQLPTKIYKGNLLTPTLVYASKLEDTTSEQFQAWVQLEQTVLNTRDAIRMKFYNP
ncbi:hypothetical protein RhiirA5_438288 [Rhizophagus irregularis]|uniref:Uncharacterized protein n=2 Tax=Rhizophagus irregularis TaxID=588596 RepID=U9UX97_RHIID|nr:hypothetical protein GLOIN_2v1769052 [Rhizophagus irregularis DAOM 181602=DAOM 197198]PKB94664.1 hypothetical protein RhiirA5_438288 [Rhizophagus irregularis]PKY33508.1 hypothetical protein RhiirB3_452458 [Rhizophagus irregularis]POG76448.1 hypothetical protein GLOIN_2v1769052 [Rhizophagus irregularis DAOM 181602=DAOM 197198]|eukprot:XP_025183314.1 hypothetical protein GLOIN_2v1769052 [Rhizophagus irregularis DAOM 181602=DAOM 197198]